MDEEPLMDEEPPQKGHPIFAAFFDRMSRGAEKRGLGELRDEVVGKASGVVVEIGAGTGRNFAHYPSAVREVPGHGLLETRLERVPRLPAELPGEHRGDAMHRPGVMRLLAREASRTKQPQAGPSQQDVADASRLLAPRGQRGLGEQIRHPRDDRLGELAALGG